MKLYIMVGFLALASLATGFGLGNYFKGVDEARAHSASLAQDEALPDPVTLDMGRLNVPIYRKNTITYVLAEITLSLADEEDKELAEENHDSLRALMLESMVDFASDGRFDDEIIDQELLSEKMRQNINDSFGIEIADSVLFSSLMKQDISL